MRKIISLLTAMAIFCAGCATARYPSVYKVDGSEVKKFEELDDDKSLKMIALIYNVRHETWEDGIARSLALEEYLGMLSRRKTPYLKQSGVFDIKYDKADIKKWKDEDLMKLYDILLPKAEAYYIDVAPDLSEAKNAERIVYLTSVSVIAREFKARNDTRNAIAIAGQVVATVLSAALAMI